MILRLATISVVLAACAFSAHASEPDYERKHVLAELYKSGCVSLDDLEFAPGSSTFAGKTPKSVTDLAWALGEEKELKIELYVQAEPRPDLKDAKPGLELAQRRGATIKSWIEKNGKISGKRITVKTLAANASPPEGCNRARGYAVNLD